MQGETYLIELENAKLLDIDSDIYGNYCAITDQKEIIFPTYRFSIDQKFRYPMIRRINKDEFLVADARANFKEKNVLIYNTQGELLRSFIAGDGIQDILIVKGKIVITYFDQGVAGSTGPNNEGVAVFDKEGNLLYGFNSSNHERVFVLDCYAVCKYNHSGILFLPYTDFPLIELDLNTFKWEEHRGNKEFNGAGSMVDWFGTVLFHGTYADKTSFFAWNMENQLTKFGNVAGHLRGLEQGRFLQLIQNGFRILNPLEDAEISDLFSVKR